MKLSFRCARGHRWSTAPTQVRSGSWCPRCSAIRRTAVIQERRFATIKRMAQKRGGECLSKTYVNNVSPLQWRCARGHEWKAAATYVDSGWWCARCKRQERHEKVLEQLRAAAKSRGGQCLTTEYPGATRPLEWWPTSRSRLSATSGCTPQASPDVLLPENWIETDAVNEADCPQP